MTIITLLILTVILVEIVALLLLKRSIGTYDDFWKTNNALPRENNALVYVALGDSAAQGIGATSPMRGYVGLLSESIATKTDRPVKIINLSKTGARLKDCIDEQLPELAGLKPDIVTIEIGANDMGDFDEATFTRDMERIIDALPPQTIISDMPYFGGGRLNKHEDAALKANKIIRDLADKKRLRVAPLHQAIQTNNNLNTYAPDFFHPSNSGYKNWHNAFWKIMEPNL